MAARKPLDLSEVADALGDMIDLADAWATCGPEGYTLEERRLCNDNCDGWLATIRLSGL